MKTSDQLDQFAAAMAAAQAQITHASFDSVNPHFRSKYASLSSVIDAIRTALTNNGICFLQSIEQADGGIYAITRLMHSSGQWAEMAGPVVPMDKNNAHGAGSATTYAKRFGLATAVVIASDDDDDGNAAAHNKKPDTVVQAEPSHPQIPPAIRAKLKKTADYIKEAISRDDDLAVLEAWQELTEDEMRQIWTAPYKGGFFTQEEKAYIHSAKHKAYTGDAA